MAAPDEPETVIPTGNGGTVIVTPPAENSEAIAQIIARMEAVETQITEAVEGERTWTATQITSLTQELADLKATLAQVATNQPEALTELRAELTRISQELAEVKTSRQQAPPPETTVIIPVETPPQTPPDNQPEDVGGPGRTAAIPAPEPGKKQKRRVI